VLTKNTIVYTTVLVLTTLYWYFIPLGAQLLAHIVGVAVLGFLPALLIDAWCAHFLDHGKEYVPPNTWIISGLSFVGPILGRSIQMVTQHYQIFTPEVVIPNVVIVIFALYFLFKYR
jgi:hypothetical protein